MIEERAGKHRWIHYFKPPKGIVCHRFPVFSWANGCPYSCAYCYLRQTLHRQQSKMVVWTNYEAMEREIKNWLKRRKGVELLNAGELADSAAIRCYSTSLLGQALQALSGSEGIYFLTKGDFRVIKEWMGGLLAVDPSYFQNMVIAFSINADPAAAGWEIGAPTPDARLTAAKILREKGWRVRIRIDPMIPFRGWQKEYENVAEIVNFIQPERVTLGSLRANAGLRKRLPPDLRVYLLHDDYVGGKYCIRPDLRLTMYRFIGGRLEMPFSLCKETREMWKESGAKGPCVCLP